MVSERQKEARRLGTGTMYECDRCGEEYESWMALIKDDFNSVFSWKKRKEEFERLCQDCNEEYFDGVSGFED